MAWVYADCADVSASYPATGPTGSLQYQTGGGNFSGSAQLLFLSSSNTLILTGTLDVSGTVIAKNFDVINHTVTYLSSSGDSKFGDTGGDVHQMTGTLVVSSSLDGATPALFVTGSGRVGVGDRQPSASVHISGSFAANYIRVTAATYGVQQSDYIVGYSASTTTNITLMTAANAGKGRTIVIKDEWKFAGNRAQADAITASARGSDKIDGAADLEIYGGDMQSYTFYSDGVDKWFNI